MATGAGAQKGAAVRYTANAINMDSSVRLKATTVDIVVNRWSTDAEREQLHTALVEQGQGKLLKTLQAMPKVGYIKTPDALSYDLHYAHRIPVGDTGAERVVLTTDRPINFWEAANSSRTLDYPFMVIELRMTSTGEGEGKLTVATKISQDPATKQIVLENYGDQPVRLLNVRRVENK
jgi:hypothetical protein